MVKTLAEWYVEYRSHINPITGERPKYKDITDQMIWDYAFEAGKEAMAEKFDLIEKEY